ncbi:MAG: HAD-IIA family hydrolase [Bacteroidales bacterium]|jgi:HAD superfamily hydrolase (TIGR01450 family)|nr:HAD-IIA family hydrolase [Bacteroidales bacterium]
MELSEFKKIAIQYKVIFFDAFGVLKNSKGVLPGIKDMISFLKESDIDFFVLTNDASRSPQKLVKSYHDAGITEITEEKIISSGMLVREYIHYKVHEGTIAYLGTEDSAYYLQKKNVKLLPVRDVADYDSISALVFLDEEGFSWELDLNKTLNILRKKTMPVILANTDKTYPVAKNDVSLAIGSIANMIERAARKKFIRFGKPDTQIFNYAFNYKISDASITKNDILMVGDSLATDILGGNHFGVDTCLVLTGNTSPETYNLMISSLGIVPDYVCNSVVE